jgi:hypothetical protein
MSPPPRARPVTWPLLSTANADGFELLQKMGCGPGQIASPSVSYSVTPSVARLPVY